MINILNYYQPSFINVQLLFFKKKMEAIYDRNKVKIQYIKWVIRIMDKNKEPF